MEHQENPDVRDESGGALDDSRERLLHENVTPHGDVSASSYEHVKSSLPPETIEAMKRASKEGSSERVDFPVEDGFHVEATNGKVGTVSGVVRPRDGTDSYIIVKEGHVFRKKVKVPFSAVDRVENNTVYLNIDKDYLKAMEGRETSHAGDSANLSR